MQADINQRLSQRNIPRHTLLAVAVWPCSELGVIRDIGLGGFSLECLSGQFQPGAEIAFDVFMFGHPERYLLTRMPCRLIYDHHKQDSLPLGLVSPLKIFGFSFSKLSPRQQDELKSFLDQETLPSSLGQPSSFTNPVLNC